MIDWESPVTRLMLAVVYSAILVATMLLAMPEVLTEWGQR